MSDQATKVEDCQECKRIEKFIKWYKEDGLAWDLLRMERKLDEHLREDHKPLKPEPNERS